MSREAFFTTTAQVLPTLLIAYAVEANAFLRTPLKRALAEFEEHQQRRRLLLGAEVPPEDTVWIIGYEDQLMRYAKRATKLMLGGLSVFAFMVVLGETCAVIMLYGSPPEWFARPAGQTCLVALIVATICVVILPLGRMALEIKNLPDRLDE